jgi:hemoglobin
VTDVNRDLRHDDFLTDHVARRRDIGDRNDIAEMIMDFYARAFADDLLGPVFVDVAKLDLAAHLPIMCDFWETVLFRAGLYRRNALQVHVDLHREAHLTGAHFARWLQL